MRSSDTCLVSPSVQNRSTDPQSRTNRVTTGLACLLPIALDNTFAHLLLWATVWVSVPSSMRS